MVLTDESFICVLRIIRKASKIQYRWSACVCMFIICCMIEYFDFFCIYRDSREFAALCSREFHNRMEYAAHVIENNENNRYRKQYVYEHVDKTQEMMSASIRYQLLPVFRPIYRVTRSWKF